MGKNKNRPRKQQKKRKKVNVAAANKNNTQTPAKATTKTTTVVDDVDDRSLAKPKSYTSSSTKTTTTTTKSTGTKSDTKEEIYSDCFEYDHFYPYLRGAKFCPRNSNCTFWEGDVRDFEEWTTKGFPEGKLTIDLLGSKTLEEHIADAKAFKTHPLCTPKTYSGSGGGGWMDYDDGWWGGNYAYKCRHYSVPVEVAPGVTIYASSMNPTRTEDDFIPDWGFYADYGWKPHQWRCENINWPDFSTPKNQELALEQLLDAYEKSEEGLKVEVGCIGGHGRTGTILACLMVIGGEQPKAAIARVHKEYCSQAIEGKKQEWFVEWTHAVLNNLEPPEMPKEAPKASTSPKGACSQWQHLYPWLREAKCCPNRGKNCTYFDQDCRAFDSWESKDAWNSQDVRQDVLAGKPIDWHRERAKAGKPHPRTEAAKSTVTSSGKSTPPKPPGTKGPEAMTRREQHGDDSYMLPPFRAGHDQIDLVDGKSKWAKNYKHTKGQEDTCPCDLCRYMRAGHGALVEPVSFSRGAELRAYLAANEAKMYNEGPRQQEIAQITKDLTPIDKKHPLETQPPYFYDPTTDRIVQAKQSPDELPKLNPSLYKMVTAIVDGSTRAVKLSGQWVEMPTSIGHKWVLLPWKNLLDGTKIKRNLNGTIVKFDKEHS